MTVAGRGLCMTIDGEKIQDGVPLQLLATVFGGVQNTIYYIAMAESGVTPRERTRVPEGIRNRYQLIRLADHNSAYAVETGFASAEQAPLPFVLDDRAQVLGKYISLVDAVSECDASILSELFPDTMWRRKVLRSVEGYCPREGDSWSLTVSGKDGGAPATLLPETYQHIGELLAEPILEEMTVSGRLMRVLLDQRRLGILHEQTSRILDCNYTPEQEEFVMDNLKGIIHVTGMVELDASGLPKKIRDVVDIRALDLSPLLFQSVDTAEGRLVLKRAESIQPSFEDGQVVFELPSLNIIASGATREEAVEELAWDLVWLWEEYALAPRDELSQDAKELAERLRDMIEEATVESG
jgi:hypothetical protein